MKELVATNASEIAAEFVRQRTAAGSPAMGMVMTLIVVVEEEGALEAMRVAGKDPAPDDQVAAQALLRALDRAVVDLPTKLKEPLLLTTMEDLSQAEVAAILGVSVKTVETRVARARRSLANTLAPLREA